MNIEKTVALFLKARLIAIGFCALSRKFLSFQSEPDALIQGAVRSQ